MQTENSSAASDEMWNQISPLLDEALATLGEKDRQAVLLRFFENKSLAEVGNKLGLGEDTARKRVSRALEKLNRYFAKRGVSSMAETLAGAISANSVQAAPMGLAKTISTMAVAKGAAASTSTLTLIKGALKIMAWSKAKTAIVAGTVVLLATATTTTIKIHEIRAQPDYWQVQYPTVAILEHARPQVSILPTKFKNLKRGGGWIQYPLDDKMMGIGITVEDMIEDAYVSGPETVNFKTRRVLATPLPRERYDFIANLNQGASNALQRAISEKFGLTIQREMVETNVLILSVRNSNADGLKPTALTIKQPGSLSITNGRLSALSCPIENLASVIESRFGIPTVDQTGLIGRFDFDVNPFPQPWEKSGQKSFSLDSLKQTLLNQLGLELVPTNMPIEMLVVEKAN